MKRKTKMIKKTVVMSFIYPAVTNHLEDFLLSICRQTDKYFELVLINDGLNLTDVIKKLNFYGIDADIIESNGGGATKVRKAGIQWLIDNEIEEAIFCDADDCMELTRVEKSKDALKENDLIFGDLILFGNDIEKPYSMFKGSRREGEEISFKDNLESNSLGMGNTAIKVRLLDKVNLNSIHNDTIAFDWLFFMEILISQNCIAKFDEKLITYYRQYDGNIAGILNNDEKDVERGLQVKTQLYKFINNKGINVKEKAQGFQDSYHQFCNNKIWREEYIEKIKNRKVQSTLWWGNILLMEDIQ